jgi:hypothetical protein
MMRKPAKRAADRRQGGRVTTDQVMAWLDERLAEDPGLRQRIERVLAALRKEETALVRRRRTR